MDWFAESLTEQGRKRIQSEAERRGWRWRWVTWDTIGGEHRGIEVRNASGYVLARGGGFNVTDREATAPDWDVVLGGLLLEAISAEERRERLAGSERGSAGRGPRSRGRRTFRVLSQGVSLYPRGTTCWSAVCARNGATVAARPEMSFANSRLGVRSQPTTAGAPRMSKRSSTRMGERVAGTAVLVAFRPRAASPRVTPAPARRPERRPTLGRAHSRLTSR